MQQNLRKKEGCSIEISMPCNFVSGFLFHMSMHAANELLTVGFFGQIPPRSIHHQIGIPEQKRKNRFPPCPEKRPPGFPAISAYSHSHSLDRAKPTKTVHRTQQKRENRLLFCCNWIKPRSKVSTKKERTLLLHCAMTFVLFCFFIKKCSEKKIRKAVGSCCLFFFLLFFLVDENC